MLRIVESVLSDPTHWSGLMTDITAAATTKAPRAPDAPPSGQTRRIRERRAAQTIGQTGRRLVRFFHSKARDNGLYLRQARGEGRQIWSDRFCNAITRGIFKRLQEAVANEASDDHVGRKWSIRRPFTDFELLKYLQYNWYKDISFVETRDI